MSRARTVIHDQECRRHLLNKATNPSSCVNLYIPTLHSAAVMSERPSIVTQIEGHRCKCLIDTGSSVTLMNKSVYNALPRKCIDATNVTVSAANGTRLNVLGSGFFKMFGTQVEFLVVDDDAEQPVILGMNVLKYADISPQQKLVTLSIPGARRQHYNIVPTDSPVVDPVTTAIPAHTLETLLDQYRDIIMDKGQPCARHQPWARLRYALQVHLSGSGPTG